MNKRKKRRSSVSYKDIQISYLVGGIDSIGKLYREDHVTKTALRKAVNRLKESGRNIAALEKWAHENLTPGVRGRRAAKPGQERTYRAQQIHDNPPFLRLPLDALEIDKGQALSVLFQKDQIVVRKA